MLNTKQQVMGSQAAGARGVPVMSRRVASRRTPVSRRGAVAVRAEKVQK